MKVRIGNFFPKDLSKFDSRESMANMQEAMEQNFTDPTRDVITVWLGDEVLFFAGVNHLRQGVGEAWILTSHAVEKNKFLFYRTIKGLIDFSFAKLGLHRLQISVDAEWNAGTKWATNLGFNYEGLAVASGSDRRDHHMFARIQ